MNILIVDDEILVRMGLKSMFLGSDTQHALFEASNGVQALELYESHKPLLVFVDITMPVMDGLEFIGKAKRLGYKTKFVILTCHDELHLIRKAIKLGVDDYIVKTSMIKDDILLLAAEVEKDELNGKNSYGSAVVDDMLLENARANVLKNIISSGLNDEIMIKALVQRYSMDFMDKSFATISLFSKKLCSKAQVSRNDIQKSIKSSVISVIKELINDYHGGYLLERDNSQMILFLIFPDNCSEEGKIKQIEEFCGRLVKSLEMYVNTDISMGVCLDGCASALAQCVGNAENALGMRFYDNQSSFHIFSKSHKRVIEVSELERKRDFIAGMVNNMDYKGAIKAFNDFVTFLSTIKPENINDLYNLFIQLQYIFKQHLTGLFQDVEENGIGEYNESSLFSEFDNIFELYEVFKRMLEKLSYISANSREGYYDKIINKAKIYILDHLDEETDLETIAGHVNLSPNYFSEIFKEKTGEKFIDYVISVRIKRAMELIERGEKVYSVMEKLGYNNYSYFCRLFKRVTGKNLRQFKITRHVSSEKDIT